MGKIGLIFDSASGLNQKEVEAKGYGFIPLIININGKEYKSGKDIESKDVITKMNDREVVIKTSLPDGKDITMAFDKALENFDQAIYIGMSAKFSGTNNAVRLMANDDKYKGKIHVYNSEYSSPWLGLYANEFEELVNEYNDLDEITRILDLANPHMTGFLSPGDIWWFYKGGRISKVQYLAGSIMKMKPILTVANGEIKKDEVPKIRTFNKAILKIKDMMIESTKELVENNIPFKYVVLESSDEELTKQTIESVSEEFNVKIEDIVVTQLSAEQTAHMGPGSFGITTHVKLKDLNK